jgi:hypothetical protein
VVVGIVINWELVWRNAERDRDEGGTGIVLRIKIFIRICMIRNLNKSRISEEHH